MKIIWSSLSDTI